MNSRMEAESVAARIRAQMLLTWSKLRPSTCQARVHQVWVQSKSGKIASSTATTLPKSSTNRQPPTILNDAFAVRGK